MKSINLKQNNKQTIIVIFGAMGDLAWRKLLPSLFDLYTRGVLPTQIQIVGVSREDVDTALFQEHIREKVVGVTDAFLDLISYFRMDLLNEEAYTHLDLYIKKLEGEKLGNRLFHLAVPPMLYKDIFINLGTSAIAQDTKNTWNRVLVEKPFGFDLKSAQELNAVIDEYLDEDQIYRVDHYLAKEAVESLMAFRFTNVLFAHSWDKSHISSVHIRMHESFGVENRGAFYESVGALRDVGQNHLLQLVALLAMEQPISLTAEAVSSARANVLKHLKIYSNDEVQKNALRGQYDTYSTIPKVPKDSITETYFALRTFIDKPKWDGVPFIIEGGKALAESRIDITLTFEREEDCLCRPDSPAHEHANKLIFTLKPENKTQISFWVKEPGFEYKVEEHMLEFTHSKEELAQEGDAYAEIIYDALVGQKIVFPSAIEVEAAWKFIDAILDGWSNNKDIQLHPYKTGSTPHIM